MFRVFHIKQVMSDTTHFFFSDFSRTDIKSCIYLPRVSGDNFAIEAARELYGKRAFPNCGQSEYYYEFWFHLTNLSLTEEKASVEGGERIGYYVAMCFSTSPTCTSRPVR